jgi:hypothetical protein
VISDIERGALILDKARQERSSAFAGVRYQPTDKPPLPNATKAAAVAQSSAREWPEPLPDDAFHGIAGEIAKVIEPHTEADKAAILLQVLVTFGLLVERGPHVRVEGDQHHANLYVVLVGDTAKARKGTSWGRVRQIFEVIPGWPNFAKGLSTGEGLKWAVRDAIERLEKDTKTGALVPTVCDPGVADKRLLVIEEEFAQALRVAQRPGNTLSVTVREAWDGRKLATLTKTDPITATGAHIGIIAHITADELRAELTRTDTANGFANRFLYVAVRRSKKLPFGGAPLIEESQEFAHRLAAAADHARKLDVVGMTEPAKRIWEKVYPELSEGHSGLLGAVTARAEAQCLRLALLYALLDQSSAIDAPHLRAALAIWEYCEASARFIFGSALGDPIADEILRALRVAGEHGLTRTQIRDLLKRNQPSERIGGALELLERRNLARHASVQTDGRPTEIWKRI